MNLKSCLIFLTIFISVNGLENLLNTDVHKGVRCLCHAVSGCYRLVNCAKYSIKQDYWTAAGSPVVDSTDTKDENGYKKCMENDNCILHTINNYTSQLGTMDCNCDSQFNFEDRLAIHYDKCDNPEDIDNIEIRRMRYRNCAGEDMSISDGTCIPEAV